MKKTNKNDSVRNILLVIAKNGELRFDEYKAKIIEFSMTTELGIRQWRFAPDSIGQAIDVSSFSETNNNFDKLGIGYSLLHFGENLKDSMAKMLAMYLNYSSVETIITDGSKNGWTTRQVKNMPEFFQNPNYPTVFHKTVSLK